jgi:hypothetical protein
MIMILSLLISLWVLEWVLDRYVPDIITYSELPKGGPPYPATSSPYLPSTLPKNVSFHHQTPEFDVVYEFNEYGYRGNFPQQISKPINKKRILICGDSFTLGWGNELDNTFVQQIQNYLNPLNYEVINAAHHAGYSPDSYYAYLVREGIKLDPDIVIVVLYSGNDVSDIQDNRWLEMDERGAPTRIETIRLYIDYQGNILDPEKLGLLPWSYEIPVLNDSHLFIAITNILSKRSPQLANGKTGDSLTEEEGWQRFSTVIKSITEICNENDIELVYVLIPHKRILAEGKQIHEQMVNIIQDQFNSRLIDMRPHLAGKAYFEMDAHFNELGNRITSQTIIDFLNENALIQQ